MIKSLMPIKMKYKVPKHKLVNVAPYIIWPLYNIDQKIFKKLMKC